MPQATCYMCSVGTPATVKSPIGGKDRPFGACCKCCSFACGSHGARVQQKFRCVLCFATTICAKAAQASGVSNTTAQLMVRNEPTDDGPESREGPARPEDIVDLYGISGGENWQRFDAGEFESELGEDPLGLDLRGIHNAIRRRDWPDLLQFAAFTSLVVEPEAASGSFPNYLERLRDAYQSRNRRARS